jgi:mRNA-degrading endonuclease HigB of HigAB toxin-antitoxin module
LGLGIRHTQVWFEEWVNTNRPDYEVIGNYINTKTKIEMKHKECGRTWLVTPNDFMNKKSGCKYCYGNLPLTKEDFDSWFKENVKDFVLLNEYKKASNKIKLQHKCGHIIETTFLKMRQYLGCKKCAGNLKKTTDEFKEFIDKNYPEYIVIGEYINSNTPIDIKHSICGTQFNIRPTVAVYSSCRCPKCYEKPYTTENFINWLKENRSDYELIGDCIASHVKIKLKHNCGYEWFVDPTSFKSGKGCPKCNGGVKHTHEQFEKWMIENRTDYKLVGKYKNSSTKLEVIHNDCQKSWFVTPSDLKSFVNCPNCYISKGEQQVEQYLIGNKLKYIRQFSFSDCKHKQKLLFDFCVFDDNDNIICLIEYDGIQHFEPVELFGGIKNFKITQKRDKIKNEYCAKNNLTLIRIKYDENVIEILDKQFK